MATLKDKYYKYILNNKEFTPAENIAFQILADMTDRRGFRQAWENVDEDIQEEIIQTWINIAKKELKK